MDKVIFCLLGLSLAGSSAGQEAPLQCSIGPVTKVYGSTPWLVYSCNDASSVVVVSAPGSAASPFYFFFHPDGAGYHLTGEGPGSKARLMPRSTNSKISLAGTLKRCCVKRKQPPRSRDIY